MIKPELQKQLDMFATTFGTDNSEYKDLEIAMQKLNEIPKKDWGKQSTIERLNE